MYSYMNIKYKYYYNCKYFHFLLNKGLTKVYAISDINQISDNPQGIIVNIGVTISILFSLFVQLIFIHKLSL